MVTYGQIKATTLKLIDEYSSRGAIQAASKIADIKYKIQDLANATIYDLATTTAKIPSVFRISHNPVKNTLSDDTSSIKQHLPGIDFSISLLGAKACFFECAGPATVVIEETSDNKSYSTLQTISIPAAVTSLTEYRRLISPTSSTNTVRLRFTGDYVYSFRNYVLYPYSWPDEASIQQHRPWFEHPLPSGYLDLNNVYVKRDQRQYTPYMNYIITPDKKFSFNSYDYPTEFLVNYWRKPNLLTFVNDDVTDDAQAIDLSDDAAIIVPWNIAGEVLKTEKQIAEGSFLINQYMVKREGLITNKSNFSSTILDVNGW